MCWQNSFGQLSVHCLYRQFQIIILYLMIPATCKTLCPMTKMLVSTIFPFKTYQQHDGNVVLELVFHYVSSMMMSRRKTDFQKRLSRSVDYLIHIDQLSVT